MAVWFVVDRRARAVGHRAATRRCCWRSTRSTASHLLAGKGCDGFLVLGGVFLCVTGAEALYADMGHFGKTADPARLVGVVFPSLVLNYAGQAAIALRGAPIANNIFYRLCPQPLLVPLVCLATVATIIASQSIITGAFSMTRQAIQLGWLPRLHITQTSDEGYGQIYVGVVNWLLMIVTIALTCLFRKSDNLAAAYGIAVSLTMLMTSFLLFIAMREIWQWSLWASAALAGLFVVVDAGFFAANSMKIARGRLRAAAAGRCRLWPDADLASRRRRGCARMRADADPGGGFSRRHQGARRAARARHRGVSHPHRSGVPPVMLWHLQAQSRAARARGRA